MAFTTLSVDNFGTMMYEGQPTVLKVFTLIHKDMEVRITNYGATVLSIKVPDREGNVKDVVLGYDTIEGYLHPNNPYMGATIGRVTNRIKKGEFTLNNVEYKVTAQHSEYSLHGGLKGFDKKVWNYYAEGSKVILTYLSKDGEEGYPGDVLVTMKCSLLEDYRFAMEVTATCTKPTIINITNHMYFNLGGHASGSHELYDHVIQVESNRITETDEHSVPTGKFINLNNSKYDLRVPKKLGQVIKNVRGLDDNYVVFPNMFLKDPEFGYYIGRLGHPTSGRLLKIYSNQPGVQIYSSNYFPNAATLASGDATSLLPVGKGAEHYLTHAGICMETQNFPDAINHVNFPSPVLLPGQIYNWVTCYSFETC